MGCVPVRQRICKRVPVLDIDNCHTLQPTALVHEAWLRSGRRGAADLSDRAHFLAIEAAACSQDASPVRCPT
ncbi:MAG: ECF-type sigma factor [Verrucomicrobiota bacterium]